MPELPEVETTMCGIKPHIINQPIINVIVRHYELRWPVPANINQRLMEQTIHHIRRRGKYLLLEMQAGTLILHLGMSGSLRILMDETPPDKHDHLDIVFANKKTLRFNDPRRFGAALWTDEDPLKHPLLAELGPEPLTHAFSGNYLWQQAKKRRVAVKSFIMNAHIVVGVGNIYATEALFYAGIHPQQSAQLITLARYQILVTYIKKILRAAIKQGGTTLKNFVDSDGKPGYFKLYLKVYGRAGKPCVKCQTTLKEMRLGQRGTVYCPHCQKK